MNYSSAYRQHKEISHTKEQIAEVKKEMQYTGFAFKIAFVATFVLYFVFVWMMYVSDLWGFSSWLAQNLSETAALLIYGVIGITLPGAMAFIKEIGFNHFAKYDNPWYVVAGIVGILAGAGVIYESITSSSQQQHISVSAAENSKSFELISSDTPTLETGSLSSLIANAEQIVARCERRLQLGKEKHCEGDKAKLASYIASEKRTLQSAKDAATAAIATKHAAVKELKEDAYKPVFKSIRNLSGASIDSAVMLVTLFISIIFEISHLLLIFFLKQQRSRHASLTAHLIDLETAYMDSTNKTYCTSDFADSSVLNMDDVRANTQRPEPITPNYGNPVPTMSINTPAPIMPTQPLNTGETQKQTLGFIDTNTHPNQTRKAADGKPVLGKAEVQLSIPETSTYKAELDSAGISTPADPAMNQAADKASIERIIANGKTASTARSEPLTQNPQNPSSNAGSNALAGRSEHPEKQEETAKEQLASADFALLKSYVENPKFGPAFTAIATGSINCSQKQAMKRHNIGAEMSKWLMVILDAGEIVSPRNPTTQQRTLIKKLNAQQATHALEQVKAGIIGTTGEANHA